LPDFKIPVTGEDWEKSGSKFAEPGNHLSEAGMPEFRERAVMIPFTIIEEGEDKGKTGVLSCSFKKFSLGATLDALGVPITKDKEGVPHFDQSAIPGKKFLSVWTLEADKRPLDEGGTGKSYPKATGALPVGATEEPLL